MSKNYLIFIVCFFTFLLGEAQITTVEYPSDKLTEEKINQILDNSRKHGVKDFEIQIQSNMLHRIMLQQKNGFYQMNQKGVVVTPYVNSSGCFNPGFENGTTLGWTFESGSSYNSATGTSSNLPCPSCIDSTSGIINQVVNTTANATVNTPSANCSVTNAAPCTNGIDNYGNFPVVAPGGGNYSLLLNNTCAGAKMQQAQYTFVVDSTLNIFTFQYAAVLQDGGHPLNESAYFNTYVTDLTTGTTIPCSQYMDVATSGNLNGWTSSTTSAGTSAGGVSYKPWTTVGLDMQTAIGHTVTVKITVSDCNQTGHFGYCYIDAACGNVNLVNAINLNGLCSTDTAGTIAITAPSGYYNYQWYGPNNNIIVGDTLQTATVSANLKDTFVVKCNSALGCLLALKYIINPGAVGIYSPTDSIISGDTITIVGTGAISYTWTSSDGGNYTGDSISIFPITNTTYTVIGSDSAGCTDTASKLINVSQRISGISKQNAFNPNHLTIYPNPANNILFVGSKEKISNIYITDIIGNKLKQLVMENEMISIDLSSLPNGVYFLNANTSTGLVTKKFVVQR